MGLDIKKEQAQTISDNSSDNNSSENNISPLAEELLPILRAEGDYLEYRGKAHTKYRNVMFFAKDRKNFISMVLIILKVLLIVVHILQIDFI